jgi:hypothetical protein
VTRYKWTEPTRNLRPGDIVLIADKSPIKGDYRLGMINEVVAGNDAKVRRALVKYKTTKLVKEIMNIQGEKKWLCLEVFIV